MQNIELIFPEGIYSEHLATINGIKFTRREVDVISCLLSARGTSKIASLLSIALRTVVTHIRNIMLKLECNSREGIIDFIEKSQKLPVLRHYYAALTTEVAFEKSLKEVSKLKHEGSLNSLVIYWEDENQKQILLTHLGVHLNLAGFKVEIREYTGTNKPELIKDPYSLSLILVKKDLSFSHPELEVLSSLDLTELSNYYFSVFEILKALLPHADLSKIFATFQDYFGGRQDPSQEKTILERGLEKRESKEMSSLDKILQIFKNKKWPLGVGIICISFLVVSCWVIKGREEQRVASPFHQTASSRKDDPIRSDLVIPTEAVLLNRPELISEIDNKLKNQSGIQTLALVGPGGAGKTTLARQYAREQKANVVWEINAETQESLRASFENLAQALTKSEEDKKILASLENIKDPLEREEKIVQFVKEHFRFYPNWLFIFDNVEKFSHIQKYFPQDPATWGQGKIIITVRDSNIQNNKYIHNIILIGELSSDEKLDLFIKIINQGSQNLLNSTQIKEIKLFLENIPPFPLDVSMAAYYLKATNVPYLTYLENISHCDKDFTNVQENLLKEAGDYTKTRYGIITISLEQIINSNKDFGELLLLINLLNSQNIPRNLLTKCKNNIVVDNFIYHLKKYSLIRNQSLLFYPSDLKISIHRSTQAIMLAYLIKKLKLKENKKLINSISNVLAYYMADSVKTENFTSMKLLLSHCEFFLSHNDLLTDNVKSSLNIILGKIYYYLGYYTNASQLFEKELSNFNKSHIENDPRLPQILTHLGMVYTALGNLSEAKNLFKQALRIYEKCFFNAYEEIAQTLTHLGLAYTDLGQYEDAKSVLEQSIQIYKKHFSENYFGLGRSLVYLGILYRNLGYFEKAKDVFEKSFVFYKTYFPKNSIHIAWVLGHLGNVYRELGNYTKAKDLLEHSYIIYKKLFPDNHIHVAWILGHLGNVYRELGNYKKAKSMLEHSLLIHLKNYGENNIETIRVLRNLGRTYLLIDNFGDAEMLINKSLKLLQNNPHPEIYISLENLAELSLKKSDYAMTEGDLQKSQILKTNAINHLKQALRFLKAHFSENSPLIKKVQNRICTLEQQKGIE